MIEFKNRKNDYYNVDGKDIWVSRSVAVVMVIFLVNMTKHRTYVLMEKRSGIMDKPGGWCVPCGYIDWDESGWDCAVRETYEETGFYIPDNEKFLLLDNDKEPFFINTSPDNDKQNIALSYGAIFKFEEKDFPYYVENYKNSEVELIKLVPLEDVVKDKYDIVFNHEKRVKLFAKKCNFKTT